MLFVIYNVKQLSKYTIVIFVFNEKYLLLVLISLLNISHGVVTMVLVIVTNQYTKYNCFLSQFLKAVVAMNFDANGSLLLTCDRLGSYFNLFRIVPHPAGSCYSAVHHLYSLYRGDTPGSVQV